jgi:hypothetical protein
MDNYLKIILSNTIKYEERNILKSDDPTECKIDRLSVLCCLEKVIDNYDELAPTLQKFFIDKAKREKSDER